VSVSTEAFVVLNWENAFVKWKAVAEETLAGTYDSKAFKAAERVRIKKNEDPLYPTIYTDANSGQNKFGGWNSLARKRHRELIRLIKKNRDQDWVEEIEEVARGRLRIVHDRDTIDENARNPRRAVVVDENEEDNESDDEEEMDI